MTYSTSDFDFELPPALIAQHPLEKRSASRLLSMNISSGPGSIRHDCFSSLPDYFKSEDLLVFNNTKVIPARLFGHKESGGAIEILLERVLDSTSCLAHVRASKSPREGARLIIQRPVSKSTATAKVDPVFEVTGRDDDLFRLLLIKGGSMDQVLDDCGIMPLPPYIQRNPYGEDGADDTAEDALRYQTVYASRPGAVAAPTAGLHFDEEMLERLSDRGIQTAFTTLHVGAGTFQPVRVDDVTRHVMHTELYEVPESVVDAVDRTRARGGKVIAVGTTVVRALESAATGDQGLVAGCGETDIFIYPGYRFRVIDALMTNFHLPRSTLLMLVSALAGKDAILAAYDEAIRERYRFFSYGDAMLLYP